MIARTVLAGFVVFAGLLPANAADAPYVGRWMFNPAKSNLGTADMTVTKANDEFQIADPNGSSYKFKIDGKKYRDTNGILVSWRQTGPSAWETAYYDGDKIIYTDKLSVSPDHHTLTINAVIKSGGKDVTAHRPAIQRRHLCAKVNAPSN